jgi:Ca-activated chloride channel family protein
MARHRGAVDPAKRGVAIWPFVAVGAVLLVLLGWVGWSWAGDVLERRLATITASCSEGDAVLTVAVTPSMADSVGRAADAWTRSRPVILDHCMRAEVAGLEPQAVLDGLTTGWDPAKLGARPGAWLPDSSLWVNRLSAQNAQLLGSQPTSIATSPVVLAMPEAAAGAFLQGSGIQWQDLPGLVTEEAGWTRFGHTEWGRFALAIPNLSRNPASALAVQSVLAGASPQGTGPVTVEMLTDPAVNDAMIKLANAVPPDAPGTTLDTLTALATMPDVGASPYDAVPALEFDLYRRNTGTDGNPAPPQPLAGVPVGGPTPIADFPFVAIGGDRVDQLQVRAAQQLREFLQTDAQQTELARAGLRVPSSTERPDPAPGIRWSPTQNELTGADANTTQQISAAWLNAGGNGQVVSVLVDVSESMGQPGGGDRTRLEWVQAALAGQVDRFGSGSMGLWAFSAGLAGNVPYIRLVATGPVRAQREALTDGIDDLEPATATHLYPSLLAVYREALNQFNEGRINRVVVIVDGRNDSPTMNYEQFKHELDKLANTGVELPVSVLAIGPDVDRDQLVEITRLTGGTFNAAEDGTHVEAALGQLLSAG